MDYYLINAQDYFASGFLINEGGAYVAPEGGLGNAVVSHAEDRAKAHAELIEQVLSRPTENSLRSTLTAEEAKKITAKLDSDYRVVSTDELSAC